MGLIHNNEADHPFVIRNPSCACMHTHAPLNTHTHYGSSEIMHGELKNINFASPPPLPRRKTTKQLQLEEQINHCDMKQ